MAHLRGWIVKSVAQGRWADLKVPWLTMELEDQLLLPESRRVIVGRGLESCNVLMSTICC